MCNVEHDILDDVVNVNVLRGSTSLEEGRKRMEKTNNHSTLLQLLCNVLLHQNTAWDYKLHCKIGITQ